MPDDYDELLARARACRAQAESLKAWSDAVRETSRDILDHLLSSAMRPFGLPANSTDASDAS